MSTADRHGRTTRQASPWWPRRDPWRPQAPQPPAGGPGPREGQLPPAPPASPPVLSRVAGVVLLTATLGLASCQAFLAAFT